MPASSAPPLAGNHPKPCGRSSLDWPCTTCGATVEMVKVAVVLLLASVTGVVEPNEHVIVAVDAGGVQVRSTEPLNPFVEVTVTVDVPACPGAVTVTGVPETEKLGVTTKPGHEVTSTLASMEPSPLARS